MPYSELNRLAWKDYATQVDFNEETLRYYTDMPEYLVLGKSLVRSSAEADVWAGIGDTPALSTLSRNTKRPPSPESDWNSAVRGHSIAGFTVRMASPLLKT